MNAPIPEGAVLMAEVCTSCYGDGRATSIDLDGNERRSGANCCRCGGSGRMQYYEQPTKEQTT